MLFRELCYFCYLSFEGFQTIMSFIIMPTFFLSGALFPLTNAPAWLQTLSSLNPLTYGVDAIRGIIINEVRNYVGNIWYNTKLFTCSVNIYDRTL